jgi:DNA-binding GntR family transcriptional regulator
VTTAIDGDVPSPPRQRVANWSFRDQAVDILREQILSGTYESGTRLNEVELADSMGISRGPLREAIQRLVAEGLVEVVPHRGAYVRSFSVLELQQMYEFREIIESGAARLAATRASADDVAALQRMLNETDQLLTIANQAAYPETPDFHRRILELANNPSLLQAGTELQTKIRIARQRSGRKPGRARAAFDEHVEIVDAIARRDPDGASAAMVRHLAHSLTSVAPDQAPQPDGST